MRQLPRILLLTAATLIVIVALLVSGLRLLMPQMDSWREPLLKAISSASGVPVKAASLHGKWENFGPTLDVRDINVTLPEGDSLKISRVTLALDVWQSLLHARWQFRQLTFWQLQLHTNTPLLTSDSQHHTLKPGQLSDLFLRQFDHFDLRDSSISFLTPSGQHARLSIPRLSWLNEKTRHRAEGEVSLTSFTGQHGVVQVRLNLDDSNGLLNNGRLWMQADDVDVRPWLGQWMQDNTTLKSARFSLAAWAELRQGELYQGDLQLKQGGAQWLGEQQQTHQMTVDNLTAHLSRFKNGWSLTVPQTRLRTDGIAWPEGHFSLLWQPESGLLPGPDRQAEFRARATKLDLQRLAPLIPLFSRLSPQLLENWQQLRPRGVIDALALDVPVSQPEETRFIAHWHDLSWQHWKLLPGMEHFAGSLTGSAAHGRLDLAINNATLPYGTMFKAPLEIKQASGAIGWQHSDDSLTLQGTNLDVQARSLHARGDFRYQQPQNAAPQLDILAGINVSNAGDAWRYFPQPLLGSNLTRYLSGAIKGGQINNATLLFAGNPQLFPFKHNDGMFEVTVPLRQATYAFQPGWPDIENLDIDLDFLNDGLWMKAQQAMLGKVSVTDISAIIPDYLKEKLIITGNVSGEGQDIGDYFQQTPLKSSLGTALEELQVKGKTRGKLNLDIPLDGQQVHASGNVVLNNNDLYIKPLDSTVKNLSGRFRFNNGNLESEELNGNWFGQPLSVKFTTQENKQDMAINVNLLGDWQPGKVTLLPAAVAQKLQGNLPWQGTVAVDLPHQGGARYRVDVKAEGKDVSSHLPAPLDKAEGSALPVEVNVKGDLNSFTLSGSVDHRHRFNSRWLLQNGLRVERGVWLNEAKSTPALPERPAMIVNLPALNGEAWLGLMAGLSKAGGAPGGDKALPGKGLPGNMVLRTPALTLGGQQWHDLEITLNQLMAGGMQATAKGKEIRGSLAAPGSNNWQLHLDYLYYNPEWKTAEASSTGSGESTIDFSGWPALRLACDECWLRGQNVGRIQAETRVNGDTLALTNGLIDTGSAKLVVEGEWVNRPGSQRTSLKGKLSGKSINEAANWFGVNSPLHDAPFNLHYDLHWRSTPWQPSEATLTGVLKSHLGKGYVADVDTGSAGQVLRLISVDSLVRKLRLDFSDTFGQGFYFDSINGTAWIKDGQLQTDNLLVDGIEADIAMQGKVDLVRRRIDMEAVVAPEISATVGVATAFAINPVVGAAVYAASKALAPLWNKISVLRYHISGPVDKPEIDEVSRAPRETKGASAK